MLKTAITAALCCVVLASAEARPRQTTSFAHERCNIDWPCEGVVASPRGERVVRAMGGFGSARKVYSPHPAQRARRAALPREPLSYGAPSPLADAIGKPLRFIAGRLVCALNVNAALAERGIRGTESALALSFMRWGHSAGGPVPGAVIVSRRRGGGHVAIVSRVVGGKVYAWNATGGRRDWREIPYRHRVIDYRLPGGRA